MRNTDSCQPVPYVLHFTHATGLLPTRAVSLARVAPHNELEIRSTAITAPSCVRSSERYYDRLLSIMVSVFQWAHDGPILGVMPKDSVSVLLQHTRAGRETTVKGMGAARAGVTSDHAHTRDCPSACQRPPAVCPAQATGLHGNRINACDATVGTRYVPLHESFTRT